MRAHVCPGNVALFLKLSEYTETPIFVLVTKRTRTMSTFDISLDDTDEEGTMHMNSTSDAINLYLDLFDENGNIGKCDSNDKYCPMTEDIYDDELNKIAENVEDFEKNMM